MFDRVLRLLQQSSQVRANERATEAQWAQHVLEIENNVVVQTERHIAERFARAMELLGDEKPEVRWGGIFALERIAQRSAGEQSTVSEVLAAYLRRHSPWNRGEEVPPVASESKLIVTILGRRKWPSGGEDKPLDLHGINLRRIHLPFANLDSAFFYDCNFEGALLYQTHFKNAWLARSSFKNANLDGAHLEGADLSDATGLTPEQLRLTHCDEKTIWPPAIALEWRMRRRR